MSIFIDTGVFVAFHNPKDENHQDAKEILLKVVKGELGASYTSDCVFDESVTVTLARTGRGDLAVDVGKMILGEGTRPFVVVLRVDDRAFGQAWRLFEKYSKRGLSFTDCTTLSLIRERGIERIASFDSTLEGLVNRID